MRNAFLGAIIFATSLSNFGVCVSTGAAAGATPEEEYKALVKEYEAALKVYQSDMRKTAAPEDRKKLIREEQPNDRFAARFLALAEKAPKSEAAVDSLVWVVRNADPLLSPGAGLYERAVEQLLSDHVASQKLSDCAASLAREGKAGPVIARSQEALLRGLMEKSPHREVRGLACFALAGGRDALSWTILNTREAGPELRAALEELAGKEFIADILRRDPVQLTKEAEDLFKRVVKEFGDVKGAWWGEEVTLGTLAERYLFELHNLAIGTKAPKLESIDLDGNTVRLSDLRGKVVVLDIWATWCAPCRKMIPHLRELVARHEGKPFVLVSISVDAEKETLRKFLQKEAMLWTHWHNGDEEGLLTAWNIHGFPTIFVLDPEGVIRYRGRNDEALDKVVDELLEEARRRR